MKIIKFTFISLLALILIISTAIFIFLQIFDTDQYLPQLNKKASLILGRPVSVGHLGLGLSRQGITLDAGPVAIADDPDFTSQPFVKIDMVHISLDLRALILKQKIHITNVLLQSPRIHFIRSVQGNFNVRSFVQASQTSQVSGVIASEAKQSFEKGISSSSDNAPQKENIKQAFPDINSIRLQDASVSFIDQSQDMPLDIWLTNINASLKDFSLSKPFQFTFAASRLIFKSISPQKADNPIFKNISGDVQLNMPQLQVGPPGDFKANGNIIIADGVIKNFNVIDMALSHAMGGFGVISKLGAEDTAIDKLEAKFSYHDKTVFIDDFLIKTNIFEFTAKGTVDEGLSMDMQTMLHLNVDVSDALVNQFEGLKILCDDSKRIAIDASLKGLIPHLKYKPNKDFRKKSQKALIKEGANILSVLLGNGQTMSQGQDDSLQNNQKKSKKKFKNILKSFLQ